MRKALTLFLTRAAASLALATASSQALATICLSLPDTTQPVLSNGFAYNANNTRNNSSPITSANVASLQLAMTHAADGEAERRGAPVVTSQTLYTVSGADVIALDRRSGCIHWKFTVENNTNLITGANKARSSLTFVPARGLVPAMVYVGDFWGNVYALSAKTGLQVWKRFAGTDSSKHMITGSFQYHNGRLYVPVATKEVITAPFDLLTPCCTSHGMLRALDAATGNVIWTYHSTANASFNLLRLNNGPSGGSIWSTPAIDPARNSLYVGIGQALSQPATSNTDAIVAIDLATGKPKWVFQGTAGDAWNAGCAAPAGLDGDCPNPEGKDLDFGAPPILATLPNGTQAIIAGQKSGVVYALNPATGAKLWSRKVGEGSNLGGVHWGMAVDKTRVYVGVSDVIVNKLERLELTSLTDFSSGLGDATVLTPNAKPGVYALDLLTGNVVWEKHPTHVYNGEVVPNIYSAALSVTNDVLFAGSLDGSVKAFRTSDGTELWHYNTAVAITDIHGTAGKGGTIDSTGPVVAGGSVFLNSGYKTFGDVNKFMGGHGNALFVFKLPGT
jgi:polyvinyl alcohol dehydrogenase (cytochrome)